jgi:hypothetical protein
MSSHAHWVVRYTRWLAGFAFVSAIICAVFIDRVDLVSLSKFLTAWFVIAGVIALILWWLMRRPKAR